VNKLEDTVIWKRQ